MEQVLMAPQDIRAAYAQKTGQRDRDFAQTLGLSEGQLVAAFAGQGVTRLNPGLDGLFGQLAGLGEVMALTRNPSCVIEKIGRYDNYHGGQHAAMVLTEEIDLRMFPAQWHHVFAVERETEAGLRRSIQVFDAAGDAVHKIILRDGSDLGHWDSLVRTLAAEDQGQTMTVVPRKPAEAPKANADKADALRREWAKMTDTHQFLRLTSKLRMNRLGAYRIAGEPLARAVDPAAVTGLFEQVRDRQIEVMIFVGNRGCIEIHGGPVQNLQQMGPWFNVLDPGFNLHLRSDHIAEVWAVDKPTQRGPAISVEAFDADGALILQTFGRRTGKADHRPAWDALVAALPGPAAAGAA
ncbi:putative hemin transport protein [Ruegeria intermedia]|uniref:Putative hemin transport protein n=1 Tax=Ruegeria intermedia TaxID=996115 RepID=A0A1M5B4J3_9RHOB|nr:ChuX/HutX family heme-like substrate-binding protein [Ruegeria intermedia]SHF37360.1 putative hemin transport protein [Ruegeria intermedia]